MLGWKAYRGVVKNVTPRRSSGPRSFARVLFFLAGFVFAAWETRVLWRELTLAVARLRHRR